MTITVKLLRYNSKGIDATLANADHHAQACTPLIQQISATLYSLGGDFDFVWEQGHNTHVITRGFDGAKIVFKPYHNLDNEWGIDVIARFSRSKDMRLFTIMNLSECFMLGQFLYDFLNTDENKYRNMKAAEYNKKDNTNAA